jgi:hypothetical protein
MHSDGSSPSCWTHGDLSTHSLNASTRVWHEVDMVQHEKRWLGVGGSERSGGRGTRRRPWTPRARLMPLPSALRSLLRTTPTRAPVPHRKVLSVTGSQASEFLQGILAASVPTEPRPFYSAVLHAQVRQCAKTILLAIPLNGAAGTSSVRCVCVHADGRKRRARVSARLRRPRE